MVKGVNFFAIIHKLRQEGSDSGADADYRANVCYNKYSSPSLQVAQVLTRFIFQNFYESGQLQPSPVPLSKLLQDSTAAGPRLDHSNTALCIHYIRGSFWTAFLCLLKDDDRKH